MPRLPPGSHARVSTGAALRCLPWTQQMALLDGVSPRSRAASASSCPSCPIPAALLGTGLQGKAGLHLGRRGELCSALFIVKTGAQTASGVSLGTLASMPTQQATLLGACAPLLRGESQDVASWKAIPGFSQELHWARQTLHEKDKPVCCWLGCPLNTAYQEVWRGQHLAHQKITESEQLRLKGTSGDRPVQPPAHTMVS